VTADGEFAEGNDATWSLSPAGAGVTEVLGAGGAVTFLPFFAGESRLSLSAFLFVPF
jgi:hypothetical protein